MILLNNILKIVVKNDNFFLYNFLQYNYEEIRNYNDIYFNVFII